MPMIITPASFIAAIVMGAISAYFAYRRKKNPYKWFLIGFFFGVFGIMAIFFLMQKKKPVQIPKVVLPVIQGPSDKFWYYLDPTHQQQGPISHNALTTAFREGKILLSTYVWNEDLPEWKVLADLVKRESLTSSP